jgi:antitoxin (DNA-binding transcriptional repressor) of toxin-antitoxin stability system
MAIIKLEDIQHDPVGYLERVREGETLVVTHADAPFAEIRPLQPAAKQLRPIGLCRGEFVTPEDFNAPLPDDILAEFEGK